MKRAAWIVLLLVTVGLVAFPYFADAQVVDLRDSSGGGAATAVTPGTTTVTGCTNRVLYGDASAVLNCEAGFEYTASSNTFVIPTLTLSSGTAGRIPYFGAAGLVTNEAGLEYDATNNQLLIPDGTSTVPSLSWSADTNTGWYRSGADIWNEIYAGQRTVVHTSTLMGALTSYQYGWYTSGFGAFDTAITRNGAAGVIRVTDGGNGIRGLLGGGAAVASATALPVPTGRVFHVTGTTNVTSITSTNFQSGACITMIFDGVLTFTDGNNIVLNTAAGNFTTSADDTLSLCYDGTNWYETSRSAN